MLNVNDKCRIEPDAEELLGFRSEPDWVWRITEQCSEDIFYVQLVHPEDQANSWPYMVDRKMLIPIE